MRIITIILTELASDKQRLINSNGDLDQNIIDIKNQLREIVLIDQMINKWNDYTSEVKQP
jgi:hypothetical protein